jgi:hypothetical protein
VIIVQSGDSALLREVASDLENLLDDDLRKSVSFLRFATIAGAVDAVHRAWGNKKRAVVITTDDSWERDEELQQLDVEVHGAMSKANVVFEAGIYIDKYGPKKGIVSRILETFLSLLGNMFSFLRKK